MKSPECSESSDSTNLSLFLDLTKLVAERTFVIRKHYELEPSGHVNLQNGKGGGENGMSV